MPMTAEELQRRLDELDKLGEQQVRANTPGGMPQQQMAPRDLSQLDLGAAQALQRIRQAPQMAPPAPTPAQVLGPQAPPAGPPTARFPDLTPQQQAQMQAMQRPGPMRSLSGLQMPPRTAVRGY